MLGLCTCHGLLTTIIRIIAHMDKRTVAIHASGPADGIELTYFRFCIIQPHRSIAFAVIVPSLLLVLFLLIYGQTLLNYQLHPCILIRYHPH
jgi:hypothetical protein